MEHQGSQLPKWHASHVSCCFKVRGWDSSPSLEMPLKKLRPVLLPCPAGFKLTFSLLADNTFRKARFSQHISQYSSECKHSETLAKKCLFTGCRPWSFIYLFVFWRGHESEYENENFDETISFRILFDKILNNSTLGNLGKCILGSIDKQFSFYYKGLAPFNSAEISQEIQSAEWVTSHFHSIQTKWSLV